MNWPSHRSNQDRWHELIKQALFTWMSTNDETVCTGFRTSIDVLLCLGYNHEDCDLTIRDYDHQHHSERGSKNPNPECSRIKGGGSMSVISTCCIVLEMSSTENGMLESSSSRKELLTALLESSVIMTLMLDITSEDTLCVPYLSSQYIVLILYNCCMLSTGQSSLVISFKVFFGF